MDRPSEVACRSRIIQDESTPYSSQVLSGEKLSSLGFTLVLNKNLAKFVQLRADQEPSFFSCADKTTFLCS